MSIKVLPSRTLQNLHFEEIRSFYKQHEALKKQKSEILWEILHSISQFINNVFSIYVLVNTLSSTLEIQIIQRELVIDVFNI